jgi:hypothetical protein
MLPSLSSRRGTERRQVPSLQSSALHPCPPLFNCREYLLGEPTVFTLMLTEAAQGFCGRGSSHLSFPILARFKGYASAQLLSY